MVSLNPEAALARELFDYSPETGLLTKKETGKSDWGKQKSGYMSIKFFGKTHTVHRVIWLWMTGDWPIKEIDHINRNVTDNRWHNLRDVSQSVNMRNQWRSYRPDYGVYPQRGKWRVQIRRNNRDYSGGTFKDKALAIQKAQELRATLDHANE